MSCLQPCEFPKGSASSRSIEDLTGTRHCFRCSTWIISFHLLTTLQGRCYCHPHSAEKVVEKAETTDPWSHCWKVSAAGTYCNRPATDSSFPRGHLKLIPSSLEDNTPRKPSAHITQRGSSGLHSKPAHPASSRSGFTRTLL